MTIALAPPNQAEEEDDLPTPRPPGAPAPTMGLAPGAGPMTAPGIPAPTMSAPPAPVDRVKLATDTFNRMAESSAPAYAAAQRDTVRNAAALGQVGSGGLRTKTGTLQLERERDLDTLRKDLVTKATEGSIADANTAYQQALAAAQQGLAQTVGLGNLSVSQGQLALAREGQGESLELQRRAQDIQQAYQNGTLSIAQRDQALRELESGQTNTRANAQLALATRAQTSSETQAAAQLAEQTATRLQQSGQFSQSLAETVASRLQGKSLDEQRLALDRLVADRTLTVQQAQLAEQTAARAQQGSQFAAQLAQTASQFGASQAQQLQLTQLADRTQNRQIDVSTAQGKNSLMLELARIMGGPSGNVNPEFLKAIAASMGITLPDSTSTTPPPVVPPAVPPGGVPPDREEGE